mmetsp:Transcript_4991/g.16265  ORF Transcript_4991/g.16265 Transcript_4991/m.16265 type:complete len:516 (-) Transcript_4991:133-1680(-)
MNGAGYPLYLAANRAEMAETRVTVHLAGQSDRPCLAGQAHFNPAAWAGGGLMEVVQGHPFGECSVESCDGCQLTTATEEALAAPGAQVLVVDEDQWGCFHSWGQLTDVAQEGGAEALVVINTAGEEVFTYQAEPGLQYTIPTFNVPHTCGVYMHAAAGGSAGWEGIKISLPTITNGEATEGQGPGGISEAAVNSRLGRVGLPFTEVQVSIDLAQGFGDSATYPAGQATFNPLMSGAIRELRLLRVSPVAACKNSQTANGTSCSACLASASQGPLLVVAEGMPTLQSGAWVAFVEEEEVLCLHPVVSLTRILSGLQRKPAAVVVANADGRISTLDSAAGGDRLTIPTINLPAQIAELSRPTVGRSVRVSMSAAVGGVMPACYGGCARAVNTGLDRGDEGINIPSVVPDEADEGKRKRERNEAMVIGVAATLCIVGVVGLCAVGGWCYRRRRLAAYNKFDASTQAGPLGEGPRSDDAMWKVTAMPNEIFSGGPEGGGGAGSSTFDGVEQGAAGRGAM